MNVKKLIELTKSLIIDTNECLFSLMYQVPKRGPLKIWDMGGMLHLRKGKVRAQTKGIRSCGDIKLLHGNREAYIQECREYSKRLLLFLLNVFSKPCFRNMHCIEQCYMDV